MGGGGTQPGYVSRGRPSHQYVIVGERPSNRGAQTDGYHQHYTHDRANADIDAGVLGAKEKWKHHVIERFRRVWPEQSRC
jgi:hypothetical protein